MADDSLVRHMQLEGFIDEIAKRAVNYIESSEDKSVSTIDYVSYNSRQKTTDLKLPLEGRGVDRVLDDIDEFLKQCVRTNSGSFMNPLWGGLNVTAFAGEVISALTNQSMYTYELAPLATLIEKL